MIAVKGDLSKSGPQMCPSAPCQVGSKLHGIVGPDGCLVRLTHPLVINKEFVETATSGNSPTKRFRFTAVCSEEHCAQWRSGACQIASKARKVSVASPDEFSADRLVPCAIRKNCRWYHQEGRAACSVCSYVVTDQS